MRQRKQLYLTIVPLTLEGEAIDPERFEQLWQPGSFELLIS